MDSTFKLEDKERQRGTLDYKIEAERVLGVGFSCSLGDDEHPSVETPYR
jgi:hypothetical protein